MCTVLWRSESVFTHVFVLLCVHLYVDIYLQLKPQHYPFVFSPKWGREDGHMCVQSEIFTTPTSHFCWYCITDHTTVLLLGVFSGHGTVIGDGQLTPCRQLPLWLFTTTHGHKRKTDWYWNSDPIHFIALWLQATTIWTHNSGQVPDLFNVISRRSQKLFLRHFHGIKIACAKHTHKKNFKAPCPFNYNCMCNGARFR